MIHNRIDMLLIHSIKQSFDLTMPTVRTKVKNHSTQKKTYAVKLKQEAN